MIADRDRRFTSWLTTAEFAQRVLGQLLPNFDYRAAATAILLRHRAFGQADAGGGALRGL
jgi:hypothetical protein